MQNPKVISDAVMIGQLGVAIVQRILLDMGFLFHATGQLEAGIDGFIELRDSVTGRVSNFIIVTQVKATQQDFPKETATSFEWPCSKRDLDYWLQGNTPMVLIVVRPATNEAYWISLKDYFRDLWARAKGRILFDRVQNRFDSSRRDEFVRLAIPRDSGIHRPALARPETLYTNLLLARPPESIYIAGTEHRNRHELFAAAKNDGPVPTEWLIRNGMLISVHDLSRGPLSRHCDLGSVERHERSEWERDCVRRNELIELLSLCLREKAREHPLLYEPMKPCLYFAPTASGRPRRLAYKGLHSETEREVFGPRRSKKDSTKILYCRHSAFEWQFLFLNGKWFLQITPTYHFTRDGTAHDAFAQERLKRIKEKEKNAAVLGQVIMWARLLARPATMFDDSYPFLGFGDLESMHFDYGIDDMAWLAHQEEEEQASAQAELEFLK